MKRLDAFRRRIAHLLRWLYREASQRPRGAFKEAQWEEAMLDMVATSPNVLLTTILLASVAVGFTWDELSWWFLGPWAAAVLAAGCLRQMGIWRFRKHRATLTPAASKRWVEFAWLAPVSFGTLYAVFALIAFPTIEIEGRLAVSLVGAGMLIGAIGFSALAGPLPLLLVLISSAGGWILSGDKLSVTVALICVVGAIMYIPARARQAAVSLSRFALIHQASKLTAELAARNSELEQMNQNKTSMLATASHDLRQPVHALALLAASGTAAADDLAEAQRQNAIRASIDLLGDMLQSLMDVSQLDGGTYTVRTSRFDLVTLMSEVASGHADALQTKGLDFVLDTGPAHGVLLQTDRGLLSRILSNLIGNAIKYTEDGGVRLTVARSHDHAIRISVIDTGIGIAPELQGDIFRMYVRAGTDRQQRTKPGFGIGLAVVDLGAKLLGLGVEFASAPREGSRFDILLPASIVASVTGEEVPSNSALQGLGDKPQIVVIEDDPTILDALLKLLSKWGHVAYGAASGPAAIELVQSEGLRPEIIISDYQLGETDDGLSSIAMMREYLQQPLLPAILLTGDVMVPRILSTLANPPVLLHKPVRPAVLRNTLSEVCKRSESNDPSA